MSKAEMYKIPYLRLVITAHIPI